MMHIIYISPHLDDAALSCGGLIYEQVQGGDRVEIWTLTAGIPYVSTLPPFAAEFHRRWGVGTEAVDQRRKEDLRACQILGAETRHLDWYDCIYRYKASGEALIASDEDLFCVEPEPVLVAAVAAFLQGAVPPDAQLVVPMAVGDHIDHRLALAALRASHMNALFYVDYPYISYIPDQAAQLETSRWQRLPTAITRAGLLAWQDAVAAYVSQILSFWSSEEAVHLALANYCAGGGGRLYQECREKETGTKGTPGF